MLRWFVTLFFLSVSALLTQLLPFSSFFRNLNTMIHEFGHAAATLLLSGKVMYIHLYEDHSGVTLSEITTGWSIIPIALAGYITASVFAVYLFRCYHKGKIREGLAMITLLAVLSLVLFVRNGYGMLWLVGFISLNSVLMLFPSRFLTTVYFLLIAFLTLEESVFTAAQILMLSWLEPEKAGDAANLAQATGIPAIAWGLMFTIVSLWCASESIRYFLKPRRKKQEAAAAFHV